MERADREGKLARRRNKKARDFTQFLNHKSTLLSTELCTVLVLRMAHMILKETKQEPGTARTGNMLGYCLISFHFLWANPEHEHCILVGKELRKSRARGWTRPYRRDSRNALPINLFSSVFRVDLLHYN